MGFSSILDLKKPRESEGGRPVFFTDLNLNRIIDKICELWEKNVSPYYYYLPADKSCEDYRREIYGDIKSGNTYEILCEFSEYMQKWQESVEKGEKVRAPIQKAVWFVTETRIYCEAILNLYEKVSVQSFSSRGMRDFTAYLKYYIESKEFCALREKTEALCKQMKEFDILFSYQNDRITVSIIPKGTESGNAGAYDIFLKNAFGDELRDMKNPFGIGIDNLELEQELIRIIQKQRPDFFKETKKFYNDYAAYKNEIILQFASEIDYYLSFYCFEKYMQAAGYSFCEPKCSEDEMNASGLYDLALACVKRSANGSVVPNDMCYLSGEKFFVLTGPNQGGKTTFARSLGQMVYFSKMGLDVPAKAARLPYFKEILTHFSVEESVETGRGKLKEELVRLQPMMDIDSSNAFVIINELFTTAANYDACIMGKRVLKHFLGRDCRGIYVTHLKELAEPEPGIVSIRAMLDENGVQSFRIIRHEAEESASAINQVNKYRLTYAQLKERLS